MPEKPDIVEVEFVDTQNSVARLLPRVLKVFVEFFVLAGIIGVLAFVLLRWVDRRDAQAGVARCQVELNELQAASAEDRQALTALETRLDALRAQGNIPAYNALIAQYDAAVDALNAKIAVYNEKVRECGAIAEQGNKKLIDAELPELVEEYIKPVGE